MGTVASRSDFDEKKPVSLRTQQRFILDKDSPAFLLVERKHQELVHIVENNPAVFPNITRDMNRNKYTKELLILVAMAMAFPR